MPEPIITVSKSIRGFSACGGRSSHDNTLFFSKFFFVDKYIEEPVKRGEKLFLKRVIKQFLGLSMKSDSEY